MKQNRFQFNPIQYLQIGLMSIFLVCFIFMSDTMKLRQRFVAIYMVLPSEEMKKMSFHSQCIEPIYYQNFQLKSDFELNNATFRQATDSFNYIIQSKSYHKGIIIQFDQDMTYENIVKCLNLAILNDWKFYSLDINNNQFKVINLPYKKIEEQVRAFKQIDKCLQL